MKPHPPMHAWSKSDLTVFTWSFGLIAIVLFAYGLNHFFRGETAEACAMAFAMMIPLAISIGFARMRRNRLWEQPLSAPDDRKTAFDRAVEDDSFLNPRHDFNLDRVKNPPKIG